MSPLSFLRSFDAIQALGCNLRPNAILASNYQKLNLGVRPHGVQLCGGLAELFCYSVLHQSSTSCFALSLA